MKHLKMLYHEDAFTNLAAVRDALCAEVAEVCQAKYVFETGDWTFPDARHLAPLQRRLAVRSMFAAIEGTMYAFKQYALLTAPTGTLSVGEQALCSDTAYTLNDKGEAVAETAKLGFKNNLQFSLLVFAKSHSFVFFIDKQHPGWAPLGEVARLRGRLMHPKQAADLTVTDPEILAAVQVFEWFELHSNQLLKLHRDYLQNSFARAEEELEKLRTEIARLEEDLKAARDC